MARWLRVLLFLLGLVIAAGGTAYFTGLLDSWLGTRTAEIAVEPDAPVSPPAQEQAAEKDIEAEAEEASTEPVQDNHDAASAKQGRLVPPSFDLLRVEPDGSVLVAGKAGSKALIELLAGETVLGSATAGEEGDFVIVLDEELAAGDYQLTLRTTVPGEEPVLSEATAIVSIPQTADGQVLAMVEEPGAPAQLITVPKAEPETSAESANIAQEQSGDEVAVAGEQEPAVADEVDAGEVEQDKPEVGPEADPEADVAGEDDSADEAVIAEAKEEETKAPVAPQEVPAATVVVEAVEIEGDTIFVAGSATPGHAVRVYADAKLLGESLVSEGSRFLVEEKRELAVGNYLIRADLIDKSGNVVARATVPFEREPGEAIAAVAAPASDAPQVVVEDKQAPTIQEPADAAPQVDAAPPAETAAPLQRADGSVIIRRGDSLWRISRRVYGHGIRYSTIYLANQDQISNPDRIWPGQVFALPGQTPEGEQADLDAIGDQAVEPQERQSTSE